MTPRAADGSELVRPQLIVPAYFHPATHPDEWAWLAERAAEIRIIVLNLASGPGAQPDTAFFPVLDRLRSAGVAVAGYVDTNYGHRSAYDDPTVPVAVLALVKAGAWPTTTVMVWVASGLTPLLAVMVRLTVPVAVGVPESRAVPLPLSVKVIRRAAPRSR